MARWWKISENIPGIVFLSGPNDTYVDAACTKRIIQANASHFSVIEFNEALHEIDNEISDIRENFTNETLGFLRRIDTR